MLSLLHVSDVHFGPKHLADRSAAVLELARRERPTAVVVSGDFTQRAKPAQFREAAAWLAGFERPVAFVPGNHDVPLYRFWERLFSPFGAWRRWFDPALARELSTPELGLFCLNTAFAWTTKHGRVESRELAALAARIESSPPLAFRVLVAHHPLIAGPELGSEPVARGARQAIELCRRAGVELVLSGHLHHGFCIDAEAAGGPLVVQCGTSSSSRGRGTEAGRTSLHWIEIDEAAIRVERRFWDSGTGEFRARSTAEFPRRRGASRAQRAG